MEDLKEEMELTFRHLYDTHWGVVYKQKQWGGRIEKWVIFPQDFQPVTGKSYKCRVQWTMMGYFKYKGQNYRVARAYLKDKAGIIEKVDYVITQKRKQPSMNPLAEAFEKAGLKVR